ncbi:MAG: PfkB family carbohydrate kinase [Acidobacteriota bacterium]
MSQPANRPVQRAPDAAGASRGRLLRLVDRFAGQRVLILGDVMLDRYWWGTASRIAPEAPVPVVNRVECTMAPGGAGNVAANVAAMGGRPSLIAIAGADQAGRDLERSLETCGVDERTLVVSRARETTVKTRLFANHRQVARLDAEDTSPLTARQEQEIIKRTLQGLPQAKVLLLSDYSKGVLSPRVLRTVIGAAREREVPILVDPRGRDYTRYNGATLIAPNLLEAAIAAGLDPDRARAGDEAARTLLDRLEVAAVVVTQGPGGMTVFERGVPPVRMPTQARVVSDVTGAGDTVMGALALAFASAAGLGLAGQVANLAGGLAVEQLGTAIVTAAQLRSALKRGARGER